MSEGFIIDSKEGIEAFRMLSIHGRLKLEMMGLRFRINTFSAVRKELNLPPRTPRKQVMAAWEKKMTEKGIHFSS